jgi:hypothetical protein
VTATLTSGPTSPQTPTPAPSPLLSMRSSWLLPLGFFLCVFVPGLLGVGGLGLLAMVWYRGHPRPSTRRSGQARASPPARPVLGPAPQSPYGPAARNEGSVARSLPPPQPYYPPAVPANYPTMRCSRCGRPYRPQARFCTACGMALQATPSPQPLILPRCLGCGQPLRPTNRFCPHCGRRRL